MNEWILKGYSWGIIIEFKFYAYHVNLSRLNQQQKKMKGLSLMEITV